MKICPNCGAQMGVEVNFCTNCGTDLRNVPVTDNQGTNPTSTMSRSEMRRSAQDSQSVQSASEQAGQQQSAPNQNVQAQNGFQQAINNFDAHNMWAWFVNSWKHPTQEQTAERWYGWVTLLVEDILIGLGFFIAAHRGASMLGLAGLTFGVSIELMFFLALGELVFIGAAYLSYKVLYGHVKDFIEFSNHIVQTSNLNAIFIVLFFLFIVIFGAAGSFIGTFMLFLSFTVFEVAMTVVVLGDSNPVHDKFYGYFLFVVLQFIASTLFTTIAISIIGTQIGSTVFNMIGRY